MYVRQVNEYWEYDTFTDFPLVEPFYWCGEWKNR